ncbi:MAG: hypothetical protein B0D92_05905 [Spirochaeta sp. LUC14_002_19_P3]|nr:MAG: hypothetical protein B0D92_05905 [Spirochaeta sp. LUC14_002_19_P3]
MEYVLRRKRLRVFAWAAVVVLAVLLFVVIVGNYQGIRGSAVGRIVLESDLNITNEQLLEMLNISGTAWGALDVGEVEQRLESYPVIRKARVIKAFPDVLQVYLYRRKPLAVILAETDSGVHSAVFDEEGYVIKIGEIFAEDNLPIISGIDFGQPVLGARFPESIRYVLEDLSSLRNDNSVLFSLVSEIEILQREQAGYDLRLFMNHVSIPILLGTDLSTGNIHKALMVLDILHSGAAGTAKEADIRGENAVYNRVKEG